jgi:hypothetical protein
MFIEQFLLANTLASKFRRYEEKKKFSINALCYFFVLLSLENVHMHKMGPEALHRNRGTGERREEEQPKKILEFILFRKLGNTKCVEIRKPVTADQSIKIIYCDCL